MEILTKRNSGTIAKKPVSYTHLVDQERFSFDRDQILDWMTRDLKERKIIE